MRKVVRVHLVETRHGNETAMFGSPFTSDFRFPKLLLPFSHTDKTDVAIAF